MASNVLAVVLAALRRVHGGEIVDEEVSLYYIANEITTTYHGMMIAIPEPEWDVFMPCARQIELPSWLHWRRVCVFKPSGTVLEGLRNLILRGKSPQGRDRFQRLNCS